MFFWGGLGSDCCEEFASSGAEWEGLWWLVGSLEFFFFQKAVGSLRLYFECLGS